MKRDDVAHGTNNVDFFFRHAAGEFETFTSALPRKHRTFTLIRILISCPPLSRAASCRD